MFKLIEYGLAQVLKNWEIAIMRAEFACQLPYSFYGIELWAVGRQEVKA
jgi:hypothetical protein